MRGSRGGNGGPDPHPPSLKILKNIWFLSITCPDPLKITKLPSQHSTLGHHRHGSLMPFRWSAFSGIWIISPSSTRKKVGTHLTSLSKSAHISTCMIPVIRIYLQAEWKTVRMPKFWSKPLSTSIYQLCLISDEGYGEAVRIVGLSEPSLLTNTRCNHTTYCLKYREIKQ